MSINPLHNNLYSEAKKARENNSGLQEKINRNLALLEFNIETIIQHSEEALQTALYLKIITKNERDNMNYQNLLTVLKSIFKEKKLNRMKELINYIQPDVSRRDFS